MTGVSEARLVDDDLLRTLDDFFGERTRLWDEIHDLGFDRVGIAEDAGGSGGTITDSLATLMVAARHATPGPLAEAFLAGWLLAASGAPLPDGLAVLSGVPNMLELRAGRVVGRLTAVPWARSAEQIVALARGRDGGSWVVGVDPAACDPRSGENLAGEPIADLTVDVVPMHATSTPVDAASIFWLGSLCRTAQIAGATQGVAAVTRTYVAQRTQFGRPIGTFQAVQQHVVAVEQAAELSTMALWSAARSWSERGPHGALDVASAKLVANRCAHSSATSAHQAHGAIGMTREYGLHRLTGRLHLWRHDFGTERVLALSVGRAVRSLPSFAQAINDPDPQVRPACPAT